MNLPASTSWTEISTFRQCPKKHAFQYLDRWRPSKDSKPLAIGVLWHDILDLHYKGTRDTGDMADPGKVALESIIQLLNEHDAKDSRGPRHEIGSTCLWMYHDYRRWVIDPATSYSDRQWRVVESEDEFRVPLLDTGIELVGRIDLVVEFNRRLWVIDHKAVRNFPDEKALELDDQTTLYIWAMRQLGFKIHGAMLNFSRTWKLNRPMTFDERFRRVMIYRTDTEIDTVVRDAAATIKSAYHPDQQHERHPDPQSCKWRCPYLDPCLAGRRDARLEVEVLQAMGFRKTQPRLQLISNDDGGT